MKNTPNGGQNPASLTIIRGADALMNTDIGKGLNILDFGGNASTTADKTQDLKIGGSIHTAWGEFSDATGNYYIVSPSSPSDALITEYLH